MLFYFFSKDPEEWIHGSYIKLGLFKDNSNKAILEEIHGSILLQVDTCVEKIFNKYLKKLSEVARINIDYFAMYSKIVLKEIILNAVIHKTYETGISIQISIYENKILIFNSACFPEKFGISQLFEPHASIPYNPIIMNAFYKFGLSNYWGIGIEKIKNNCLEYKFPLPKFKINSSGLMVRCNPNKEYYQC